MAEHDHPVRRPWHRTLPAGLALHGKPCAAPCVEFFADTTWLGAEGVRRSRQTIFDAAFRMIEQARTLVVLDVFLFNDFQGRHPERTRLLSGELTERLLSRKAACPGIRIVVITDPLNTVYGSIPSEQFVRLRDAGIDVVLTDLTKLRDPCPAYSLFWRALVRPFGNSARGWLPSPLGRQHKVTLRAYLAAFNVKANHRKTLLADCGDDWQALVTSANPHDASSAHTNIAVRFTGAAVADLLASENAVLEMSGRPAIDVAIDPSEFKPEPESEVEPAVEESATVRILTEGAIRAEALRMIDASERSERLSVSTFYLSHRRIVAALKVACRRGVAVRLLLDPNKDAFGHAKFGIPNRQVARELRPHGIDIRWMHTHGEQCHTKLVLRETMDGGAELLAGSANLTRRNLDNFNLETSVLVTSAATHPAIREAKRHFDLLWYGQPDRQFSVPYEHYADRRDWKHWLYRFMEATGFSTW